MSGRFNGHQKARKNRFKAEEIVYKHLWDSFSKIPKKRLIDFAGPFYASERYSSTTVLGRWKEHFESLNVPFVVTKSCPKGHAEAFFIWKERRV